MEPTEKSKQLVRTYCKKEADRNDKDCYLTPKSMIQQFLDAEKFDNCKTFLEPCSNKEKHIEEVLRENNYNNVYSNVYEDDPVNNNFLEMNGENKYDYIISNTPYKNANDFILQSFKICKEKVCLLFPLDYCNGITRYQTIYNHPEWKLSKMYIYVRKSFLEKEFLDGVGQYYKTGMGCYCFFVFEKNFKGECATRWINNNKYVLGSKDCDYRYNKKTGKIEKRKV